MASLPKITSGNDTPLYNIGIVARMTGVSMATLRAWERRYDFPESGRTAGGHRLYSDQDVFHLRWVKDRIGEGMQTAQAINALKHQESVGKVVFQPQIPFVEEMQEADFLGQYRQKLLHAILDRDSSAGDILLGDAIAISTPEDVILDLISPTIAKIGDEWEIGHITVADEHWATNWLRHKLIMWMMSGAPPRAVNPVVLACAPNEWHEGSLLVLGALLRRRQWPIAYFGQSLPLSELEGIVNDLNPPMIILAAMTETSVKELIKWPEFLSEAYQSGRPVVGYGGRIFITQPEWREKMAGIYLGDTIRQALARIIEFLDLEVL